MKKAACLSAALFLTAGIQSTRAITATGRQPMFYTVQAPGAAPAPGPFAGGPGFGAPGFGAPGFGAPGGAPGVAGAPGAAGVGGSAGSAGAMRITVPGGLQPDSQHSMSATSLQAAGLDFNTLDTDPKDGVITLNETATWASIAAIPFFEVKRVFAMADKNADGRLTQDEIAGGQFSTDWHNLRSSFRAIDSDSDGFISKKEWDGYCLGWMEPRPPQKMCEELFTHADFDAPKGKLTRNEFDTGGKVCRTPTDGGCSLLQAAMQQATDTQQPRGPGRSKTGFLQQLAELQQRYPGMHH